MKKVFFIFTILITLTFSSCIKFNNNNDSQETTESETIITDNGWIAPNYENIETSQYNKDLFKKDNRDRILYNDNDYYSKSGIDVSSFQGNIDWKKVASDGIDYVMLRIGFRGYGPSGLIYEDEKFEENYAEATAAGLDIGVYFFSQCITQTEAEEEASFIYNCLLNKNIKYPVVFDWEHVEDESARTNSINSESVTVFAKSFCNKIKTYGLDAAIYFNCSDGYNLLDLDELSEYNFWLAEYDETPSFYYDYSMWQYTDKGTVDGISGKVDLNISIEPK